VHVQCTVHAAAFTAVTSVENFARTFILNNVHKQSNCNQIELVVNSHVGGKCQLVSIEFLAGVNSNYMYMYPRILKTYFCCSENQDMHEHVPVNAPKTSCNCATYLAVQHIGPFMVAFFAKETCRHFSPCNPKSPDEED